MTSKKQKTTPKKTENSENKSKQRRLVLGMLLLFLAVVLTVAFVSYFFTWQADQSIWNTLGDRNVSAQNWMSKIGAFWGILLCIRVSDWQCLFLFLCWLSRGLNLFLI